MVSVRGLREVATNFSSRHREYADIMQSLARAPDDRADTNIEATITAEGLFVRYFTLWESSVEKTFLYFCAGGKTLNGTKPTCRITGCSREQARDILAANVRHLDWSKQDE